MHCAACSIKGLLQCPPSACTLHACAGVQQAQRGLALALILYISGRSSG